MRGALAARSRVMSLADAGVPGAFGLSDLTWGLQRTKVAGTLVTSGLADALGKDWRDPVDLAHKVGAQSHRDNQVHRSCGCVTADGTRRQRARTPDNYRGATVQQASLFDFVMGCIPR